MNKIFKCLTIMTAAFLLTFSFAAMPVSAIDLGEDVVTDNLDLGDTPPTEIAANLIKIILSFLGILAVIIILIGGFKWMTAGGNEDQVAEARKIIVAGIIGLVIILASWGIASFVLSNLITATGAN